MTCLGIYHSINNIWFWAILHGIFQRYSLKKFREFETEISVFYQIHTIYNDLDQYFLHRNDEVIKVLKTDFNSAWSVCKINRGIFFNFSFFILHFYMFPNFQTEFFEIMDWNLKKIVWSISCILYAELESVFKTHIAHYIDQTDG